MISVFIRVTSVYHAFHPTIHSRDVPPDQPGPVPPVPPKYETRWWWHLVVVAGSVDSFNGQVDTSLGLHTADRLNHHRGRRAGTRNLAQLSGGRMTGRFNSGL